VTHGDAGVVPPGICAQSAGLMGAPLLTMLERRGALMSIAVTLTWAGLRADDLCGGNWNPVLTLPAEQVGLSLSLT